MWTDFLKTWQGVSAIALILAFIIVVVIVFIKNIEKFKEIKVGKDGVSWNVPNLAGVIPRLDSQCQERLMSIVQNMCDIIRAELPNSLDRPIKMLVTAKIISPLFTSISRNHLASRLGKHDINDWYEDIRCEIYGNIRVIEDYCGIEIVSSLSNELIQKLLKLYFVENAKSLLITIIHQKIDVYKRLPEGAERERLIEKNQRYLEGLQ